MSLNEYHKIIANLIPTHNELRNPDKVKSFLKARRPMSAKISIIENQWYLHDGHHRVVAHLKDPSIPLVLITEYYSLADYRDPNPPLWLTPFDPISEVRLADFGDYKRLAREKSPEWMLKNKHLFAEERRIHRMVDLANAY